MAQIVTNDPNYFLDNVAQGNFNDQSSDNSGLGIYPAAEQNNTYFAYFNAATSTEPEILNKSAVYINYLIDSNGNLTNPKPGDNALFNLKNTFSQGSTMFITPEDPSQVYSPLIGENIIENIGTVQLILTSETGKSVSDFLNDIKIATRPRYNQTFAPDYSTGQSLPIVTSASLAGGPLILTKFQFLSSSAISNTFTSSFAPLYYASASNGNLGFSLSISGSPSDTGSLSNMSWDTVDGEWTFINLDSPFELNTQLTAECKLNFSAFIDTNLSRSVSGEDYSWAASPWPYTFEAKFELWDANNSVWNTIDIDVNASKYAPNHGIYTVLAPPGTPGLTFPTTIGIAGWTKNQFPTLPLTFAPASNAPDRIENHITFLDNNDNIASQYAKKILYEGKAVGGLTFTANSPSNPQYSPISHTPLTNYVSPSRIAYYQGVNNTIQRRVSIYGDGYIYIKSAQFSPKYNDKLRVAVKIVPGPTSEALIPTFFNSIEEAITFKPISIFFTSQNNNTSYIQTFQNYDSNLIIPANGVLPINPTVPTYVSASYWNTGSIPGLNDNTLMWLTASKALSDKILSSQNYYQNFYDNYGLLSSLGYTNPTLPIDPLPGDYIRFEYDETKQYRILAIDRDSSYGFSIGVHPPVPSNTKLNHFTISRVVDDGNYIIINTEYPASGSITDNLTGFTKPKFITQTLEDEFTTITTDLVKSGVLKNQI
jgi:hypothetical protein